MQGNVIGFQARMTDAKVQRDWFSLQNILASDVQGGGDNFIRFKPYLFKTILRQNLLS